MRTLLRYVLLMAAMGACTRATVTRSLPDGDGQGESQGDVLGEPKGEKKGDSENNSEGGSENVSDGDSSSQTGDTQGDSGELTRVSLENLYVIEDTTLTCASINFQKEICKLDRSIKGQIHSVALLDQHSSSSCVEGVSFFAKGRRVVVKEGCRGLFRVEVITNQRSRGAHTRNNFRHIDIQGLPFGTLSVELQVGDTVDLAAIENVVARGNATTTQRHGGIGVQSDGEDENGDSSVPYQVNHNIISGESEALVLGLPANAHDFVIHVSRLFRNEGNGESMIVAALDASGNVLSVTGMNKIHYKRVNGERSQHEARFKIDGLASFLVLIPTELTGGGTNSDSSDFLFEELKFKVLLD